MGKAESSGRYSLGSCSEGSESESSSMRALRDMVRKLELTDLWKEVVLRNVNIVSGIPSSVRRTPPWSSKSP